MKKTLWLALGVALAVATLPATASADTLDCLSGCSETFAGAFWTTTDSQATGSGVIQSFVRISTNQEQEEGYNTSFRPLEFDENNSPTFTRDLALSVIPIVNINGTNYREFLLDINQNGTGCTTAGVGDSCLSLDAVEIYVSATAGNTGYPGGLGTLIYDMDASEDNSVYLNYLINSGSGSGDLFLYVPDSLFSGNFVYLYSHFGDTFTNNDGFEEWAVRITTPTTVPEPTTLALLGLGLLGVAATRLRR